MRMALDTSILVAFFIKEDKHHEEAFKVINDIIERKTEYGCFSAINLAEMGYVIERVTDDEEYAYNCMYSGSNELSLDIIPLSWDFITNIAHLKAKNAISFCDNATITAARLTKSKAVFTKEKEIVQKSTIEGAEIVFLDEIR